MGPWKCERAMAGEIWTPWWTRCFRGGVLGFPFLCHHSFARTVAEVTASGPRGDGGSVVMTCHHGVWVVTTTVSNVYVNDAQDFPPCVVRNVMWLGCSSVDADDRGLLWGGTSSPFHGATVLCPGHRHGNGSIYPWGGVGHVPCRGRPLQVASLAGNDPWCFCGSEMTETPWTEVDLCLSAPALSLASRGT